MSGLKLDRRRLMQSAAVAASASAFVRDLIAPAHADDMSDRVLRVSAARDINTVDPGYMVGGMEMIGMVKDQALQTEFHLADMKRRGYNSCALILQKTTKHGTPGPIVGAAFMRSAGS